MRRGAARVLALVMLSPLAGGPATAQVRSVVTCDFQPSLAGPIRGRIIDDLGEPVSHRAVQLHRVGQGGDCTAVADTLGRFEFNGLAPGQYRLEYGRLGLAAAVPLDIEVVEGSPVHLEIPAFRENRVAECLALAGCAPILAQLTHLELAASDTLALELLALRVSIALAGEAWDHGEWVACVEAPTSTIAALRLVFSDVVPVTECELGEPAGSPDHLRARLEHVPSGRPARSIRPPRIQEMSGAQAVFNTGYFVGPLWGEGHRCVAILVEGRWRPQSCRMTWVS